MSESIVVAVPDSSPAPHIHRYYRGLKERTFYITDEIDANTVEDVGLELIRADQTGDKLITIYLNTPGGCIFSGFNLCNIIENLKSPVEIIVLGYAYSMGGYILMAGYNKKNIVRRCYSFSTALMHGGSAAVEGTASQVKDFHRFAEKYDQKIKDFFLSHSNFTEEEYDKIERTELYLTAEEMLEKGLVDEII